MTNEQLAFVLDQIATRLDLATAPAIKDLDESVDYFASLGSGEIDVLVDRGVYKTTNDALVGRKTTVQRFAIATAVEDVIAELRQKIQDLNGRAP